MHKRPEAGQERIPVPPINVPLRHLLVPRRSARRDHRLRFKENVFEFSRMQREQPPHHGETFGRGHSVHRDVKRLPSMAAREQRLVEDLWRDPVDKSCSIRQR